MNLQRLYEILRDTTTQLRIGEPIEEETIEIGKTGRALHVTHVYAMPATSEVQAPEIEKVDVHFIQIGVDKNKAQGYRAELIDILKEYPDPERLAGGPSYIEVGGVIGDQSAALCLFALGKVLKLWDVITPAAFGIAGAKADELAGHGFITITGFKSETEG